MKKSERQVERDNRNKRGRVRWASTVAAWLGYIFVFFLFKDMTSSVIVAVALLPIIVASWYFGFTGSILSSFLAIINNAFLLQAYYDYSWIDAFISEEVLFGYIIFVIVAFIVAFLSKRYKIQSEEILVRKALEKELQDYINFLTLINNITRAALETEDLPTMLQTLANRMSELLGTDNSFITLWDDEQKLTEPIAAFGPQSSSFMSVKFDPDENTLTKHVLTTGQALFIFDVASSPYVNPKKAPKVYQGSMLVLPLIAGEHKLGAAILAHNSRHHFSENEITRGEMAARHISLAISKGFFLEDEQSRAKHQTALLDLSGGLAATLDVKGIAQMIVDSLSHKLGYANLGFYLVDAKSGDRVLQASAGWPDNPDIIRIPPGRGTTERPLLDGQLHYSPDVRINPHYFSGIGTGSEVDVPIWIDGRIEGVLAVEREQPHSFNQIDFDVLSSAANLAGLALTRSKLLSAERKQFEELAILHAIALAVTEATNEDDLIERATSLIGENLYPDNFGILLVDDNINALRVHPSYSINKKLLGRGITVPIGFGVVGHVAETGLPERISDVSLIPYYHDVDSDTHSELAVPMKLGKRVIGVINAESNKPDAFSGADERLLITLAGQLATAIDRLRATAVEREWAEQLARSNALIEALGQVAARIGSASNLDGVLETLGGELKNLKYTCLVALCTPGGQDISIRYASFEPKIILMFERISNAKLGEYRVPIESLSSHIDLSQRPHPTILADPIGAGAELLGKVPKHIVARVLKTAGFREDSSVGNFPLLYEGRLQGLLWLWGENLREEDLPAMSIFANQVAVAIENARLFSEVQKLATTDELTGLYNRRHFQFIAEKEFNRGLRYQRALSAMLLDIDHFKDFNDKYGHAIGDTVLREVATTCAQTLRKTDILGRYGGEEFVILLPETNLEVARNVAERLRKRISETLIPTEKGDLSVTVSIGVAENNKLTPTLDTLIARADQAMYVAKHKGRDSVAVGM